MQVQPEDIKIKAISEEKNTGTYSIEPLPTGFGNTLGNALRRVLLSSIPGAGITQIKIKGVTHEFSSIKGVKEDVVELTLNLKKLRFRVHSDSPVVATISKKGAGKVTAGDIKVSSEVEIMDKKQHIATLADAKSSFDLELIIEPGTGYSPSEDRPTSKIGVVVLDTLFSPVVHAVYTVEPTRFGKDIDLDKIVMNIETDGSITPLAALKKAGEIITRYFLPLSTEGAFTKEDLEPKTVEAETGEGEPEKKVEHGEVAVEDLPLQTRTINALKKSGITTLQKLAQLSDEELADIKNLGAKSLTEITKLLKKEGLK